MRPWSKLIWGKSTVPEPLLSVHGLVTGYGPNAVVEQVDLSLCPGESVALLGVNGAGKTTLVSTIAGLNPLWSGSMTFRGDTVTKAGPEARATMGISLCPEGRQIFTSLTVEENLLIGATPSRRRRPAATAAQVQERLARSYERFPILKERRHGGGGQLSGGEQQMLAIARALMSAPELLMVDEPSMGLAPAVASTVYGLLRELKREGLAMIVVEESSNRALGLVDQCIVLRGGRSVLSAPVGELPDHATLLEVYLGSSTSEEVTS